MITFRQISQGVKRVTRKWKRQLSIYKYKKEMAEFFYKRVVHYITTLGTGPAEDVITGLEFLVDLPSRIKRKKEANIL